MIVIWQTKDGTQAQFEHQFIDEVLLQYTSHENIYDSSSLEITVEGALIVYSCDKKSADRDFLNYLGKFKSYTLLHLSNEHLNHNAKYYEAAKIVLRSYFDPSISFSNTYSIPLGFQSGFLRNRNDLDERSIRPYIWSFAGKLKNHRKKMLGALQEIKPNLTHLTKSWGDVDGLSVAQLQELYEQTIFIPCPFGNVNPDSFRIMESLECGCIPVCLEFRGIDYFKYIYGNHPFLLCKSWEDAAVQIHNLMRDPIALNDKQFQVKAWYKMFKRNLMEDMRQLLVFNNEADLVSEQFIFQMQGKKSLRIRVIFWLHFLLNKVWKM